MEQVRQKIVDAFNAITEHEHVKSYLSCPNNYHYIGGVVQVTENGTVGSTIRIQSHLEPAIYGMMKFAMDGVKLTFEFDIQKLQDTTNQIEMVEEMVESVYELYLSLSNELSV